MSRRHHSFSKMYMMQIDWERLLVMTARTALAVGCAQRVIFRKYESDHDRVCSVYDPHIDEKHKSAPPTPSYKYIYRDKLYAYCLNRKVSSTASPQRVLIGCTFEVHLV